MRGPTRAMALAVLLATGGGAQAATVVAEAFAIASNSAAPGSGSPLCTAGSSAGFDCERVAAGRLGGNGDPPDYSLSAAQHFEYNAPDNPATEPPNFIYDSDAFASANLGSLHASAFVQIQGKAGTTTAPSNASARGFVQITDNIRVTSSTLAAGTLVSVHALLDVNGSGPGKLTLSAGSLSLQSIGLFNQPLTGLEGTFQTAVGSSIRVVYSLEASVSASVAGWRPIDILNGRNQSSEYGNSAHLYFDLADPALDAHIVGLSGFDYAPPPAPVPLPGALALFAPALLAGACRARRRQG